ncbi:MAG: hypothetical protein A2Z75_00675 [Chloroflexi bacterium RBG_13_50_10]|nr:MAG: hypothetical protein A2Z75_00675 [Chloroflexi bacterium RBG_13_50_10]
MFSLPLREGVRGRGYILRQAQNERNKEADRSFDKLRMSGRNEAQDERGWWLRMSGIKRRTDLKVYPYFLI